MIKWGNKQLISIAILFLAVLIAFIAIKPRFESKIKALILSQTESIPELDRLEIQSVKIKLLPPHVRIHGIEADLKNIDEVKSVRIKQVEVYPTLVNLLSAQLKVKHVHIEGTELEVLSAAKKSNDPLPEFTYEQLRALPLISLSLEDTKVKYLDYQIFAEDFSLKKKWSSVEAYLKRATIAHDQNLIPPTRVQSMRMNLYSDKITLGSFTINTPNSYLQMGASLDETFNTALVATPEKLLNADINITSRIQLADYENLARKFIKDEDDVLKGVLYLSAYNKMESEGSPKLSFSTRWNDFKLETVQIDQAEVHGTYKNNIANIHKIELQDQGLKVLAEKMRLRLDPKQKTAAVLNSTINVKELEIGKFLAHNINLRGIPLFAPLKGQATCKGPVYPTPELSCQVDGQLGNIKVWSQVARSDKSLIVDLTPHRFTTEGTLDSKGVKFQSSHQFNESMAETKGQVDFEQGFDIQYSSSVMSFNDINNLANIPLQGLGKISGSTKGTSRTGVFNINAEFSDFNFFDYQLGAVTSQVSYEKGHLYFKNSQSKINSSIIYADIELDILESLLYVKAHSNKVFVQDIFSAIKNVAEVPIYISGEGEVQLNLEGPLDLGAMSYDLQAQFGNGILHKDRYQNLNIDVKSQQGQVEVQSSIFYLSDQFNVQGKVDPQGNLDIIAIADSINLANINFFKELGINLEGMASVKIDLKDHILLPEVSGHAMTKSMDTAANLGSSDFEFKVHKDYSEFEGSFFDGRAKGHFMIPHHENATLGAVAEYSNFNPMALLTMFNRKVTETEAQINITGSSHLISHGNLKHNLTGTLSLESVTVGRESSYSLQSVRPTELKFDKSSIDGRLDLQDPYNNVFNIRYNKSGLHTAKGSLNLGFLRAFIPDLSDSRGMLDLQSQFRIFPEFKMTGQGKIRNLFVKIENLKHPFQNIFSDLELQNTRVLFQGTRGEFAGGTIDGAGYIDLQQGLKVNFAGKAERISLDIPEDVKTTSSGNFYFTGDHFPYTLGGNFKIFDGFFEMEFAGGDSSKYSIPLSQHIPESERARTPLLLDVKVETQQPLNIKNSMVDGSARAKLRIEGSPASPILTGSIDVTPNTQLIFQDKRFNTNSGQITFNQTPPEHAQLNINAETRITDNNEILGKDYDIQVIIQGTASSPALFFSSQPSLSENQILSLIALGVKDSYRPGQEVSADSQQSQTGYQLGGIFLQNEFARDLQDRLGVQVNFTSSFEDQDVSPKVMIQKKFSPQLSVTGSRTLGTNKRTSTQIEYKFTKNFSIIGGWENFELEDATLLRTRRFLEPNVVGVDVQYSFEFE